MKNWQTIFMYILAGITSLGFISLVMALIFHVVPESNNNLVYLVIGLFGGYAGQVYNYIFGSSKGSADKTNMLYNSTPIKEDATK